MTLGYGVKVQLQNRMVRWR